MIMVKDIGIRDELKQVQAKVNSCVKFIFSKIHNQANKYIEIIFSS